MATKKIKIDETPAAAHTRLPEPGTDALLRRVEAQWLEKLQKRQNLHKSICLDEKTRMCRKLVHDFKLFWKLLYRERFGARLTSSGHPDVRLLGVLANEIGLV